jgi:hypothetical protein
VAAELSHKKTPVHYRVVKRQQSTATPARAAGAQAVRGER